MREKGWVPNFKLLPKGEVESTCIELRSTRGWMTAQLQEAWHTVVAPRG
ncbi:uncharacterized protein G2W53_030921 [Senna tora]|uniref:Uncharacterized protein n=1 Tax=Senna tora TaxID=362788 RepID=A0A834WC09_9FABA|nr:uncharacterized protein G2W53_030921 [Senna tora]